MKTTTSPYRIIISGGGTGGHIYPAIAIANALRAMHADTQVLFVGAEGRMEMQKVPEAGYRIEGLWISGLQRRLTADNLAFPLKVIVSVVKSFRILAKFRPDVAVGVGGFASGPLLYAASLKKIPSLLQEQNSYAGLTNKMLANQVQKICVAHHGMERFFPEEKLVFTGNPIRRDIVALAAEGIDHRRAEGLAYFELSADKPVLLVVGGSLGARTLNTSVLAGIDKLVAQGIQVIWQSGKTAYQTDGRPTGGDRPPSGYPVAGISYAHGPGLRGGRRGGFAGRSAGDFRIGAGKKAGHFRTFAQRSRRPPAQKCGGAGKGRRRPDGARRRRAEAAYRPGHCAAQRP